ncbi:hypothetical protein GCK32_020721, partial [Trichostrongylus colubriformis]
YTKVLVLAYLPIGCAVFLIRLFPGSRTFLVACLLWKSTIARSIVLRVMCIVLGIAIQSAGKSPRAGVIVLCHLLYPAVLRFSNRNVLLQILPL